MLRTDLLTDATVLTDDFRLETVERPQYTITQYPKGRATLRDWPNRRTYDTDAVRDRDRLTRTAAGEISFVDAWDNLVSFLPDGSRSVVERRGAGKRFDLDRRGRRSKSYNEQKALVEEYTYEVKSDGIAYLNMFQGEGFQE